MPKTSDLDIVMASFMLYGQKMKKVRMDYSCPHGNYSILVVFRYMYMASYKKNAQTGTKLSNFSTFSGFSQKPETSKAHRNNSRNIVTREKRRYFISK